MAEIVTLYHGSKGGIVGDIAPTSRSCCDFGRGFYMGTISTQPLTLICGGAAPKFYELSFDLEGLRVHRFCEDLDWAMFVAWNRGAIPLHIRPFYDSRFLPVVRENDVLFGRIADDRIVIVLEWFFRNFISDVGLVECLTVLKLGDQYCAVNERACRNVSIISERVLSVSECENLRVRAENQRAYAVRMVDAIRLKHLRDGSYFWELVEKESGVGWNAT